MAAISNTDLQDIAVHCTSAFLNGGTPLATSLAKQASDRGLNSDQVKRAIEATNTLCYLKGLEVGSDRTFEFPVAEYGDVIKQASVPDGFTGSGESLAPAAESGCADDPFAAFLKQASVSEDALAWDGVVPDMSERDRLVYLQKAAAANETAILNLAMEAEDLVVGLHKAASEFKSYCRTYGQDPTFVLSGTSLSQESLEKVARFVGITDFVKQDFAEGMLTKAASNSALGVKHVQALDGMIKRAFEVQAELVSRQEKAELVKQAFLANLTGRAVGGLLKLPGKAAVGAAKLAAKPFVAAGEKAMNGAKDAVQNKLSKIEAIKDLGIPPAPPRPPMPTSKKLLAGSVGVGLTGAFDASMYSPKISPVTGQSQDVWSQLHG